MVLFQGREPLTARELSRRMGYSGVTVSRFVKALAQAGWLERSPDPTDGRAYLLTPTAKARDALPRFIGVSNALLDDADRALYDAKESGRDRICKAGAGNH